MRCFWNLANLKIINHPLVVSNMSINSANVFLKREEEKNIFCYFSERERERVPQVYFHKSATGLFPQDSPPFFWVGVELSKPVQQNF